MLHKKPETISSETFSLIQQLQLLPELEGFHLVGGTALALMLGHRNSIDIDLFSRSDFDYAQLTGLLKSKFSFDESFVRKNTIIGFIDKIKVDFITHPYDYVRPPITEEEITFLSKEDISAMKLNAIVNSGQRLKDFIDVYFLLEHFSVSQMLTFYEIKYPNTNPLIALKALSYFDDIDETVDAPRLLKPLPLKKIRERISKAVIHAKTIFESGE